MFFIHSKQSGYLSVAMLTVLSVNLPMQSVAAAQSPLTQTDVLTSSTTSKQDAPILLACASCGCSEVCPLALADPSQSSSSLLSESIWGNIILKMAYQQDHELQRLAKKLNFANVASVDALVGISGGTLSQNIVSMGTLNPPDGHEDSYVPGSIGLALDGLTNVVFGARTVINYRYHKKLKERQLVVRQRVERLLEHLEFSKTDCAEAQTELTHLIGERAAKECLQLWQSSHLATATPEQPHPLSDADLDSTESVKSVVERFATARAF